MSSQYGEVPECDVLRREFAQHVAAWRAQVELLRRLEGQRERVRAELRRAESALEHEEEMQGNGSLPYPRFDRPGIPRGVPVLDMGRALGQEWQRIRPDAIRDRLRSVERDIRSAEHILQNLRQSVDQSKARLSQAHCRYNRSI